MDDATGPYAAAAWQYREAGYAGVIPIGRKPAEKSPPLSGYTGWAGVDPSGADVQTWVDGREGARNIGWHIPRGFVGVDVDAYHRGDESLRKLEDKIGRPLPSTWTSTARGQESVTRHHFYRADLPDGRTWRDHPGAGIDSLHVGHRYAMVWPSVNPDCSMATVCWYDPTGELYEGVPDPAWFTALDPAFIDELSHEGTPLEGTGADDAETRSAIERMRPGPPCPRVSVHLRRELDRIRRAVDGTGSLHEPGGLYPLVAYGLEGHAGVREALSTHQVAYVKARSDGRGETEAVGDADWWRQVRGAVGKKLHAAGGAILTGCDCGEQAQSDSSATHPADSNARRTLRIIRGSQIVMRATRWFWEEDDAKWMPLGGLTLLGGREGIGKSTWGYRLAALLTRGALPGTFHGQPKAVVVVAGEDAWDQTIAPRLAAAGADLELVLRVDAVQPDGALDGLSLPEDTAALTALCHAENVGMVLLDPLLTVVSAKLDTHKDAEVRKALGPLSRLADETQTSVIGLIHVNKSQGNDLLTRLMASRAFAAVARSVLVCNKVENVDALMGASESFLFGQAKSNLGKRAAFSYRYTIEGARVGYDKQLQQDIWSSRINIEAKVTGTIDDLVAEQETPKRDAPKTSEALDWLVDFLRSAGAVCASAGVPSQQAKAAATTAGHTERAIRNAREKNITVISTAHNPNGPGTVWYLAPTS